MAPDLLRWQLPRIAPDGLLRPGLTISLARYPVGESDCDGGESVHLVVRTPPSWADAGQRFSLALWDGSRSATGPCPHPHPRPDRRFRLDLHRHLWDADHADELRVRSGADHPPAAHPSNVESDAVDSPAVELDALRRSGCAVDRWAAEALIVLRAQGRLGGVVAVRLGSRQRLLLELDGDGETRAAPALRLVAAPASSRDRTLPVLPDAATWVPPDLALLRAGLIEADQLHPLVAAALVPDRRPARTARIPAGGAGTRLVDCRGARHRIGLVNGVLVPLDHDPAELRREELLAALTGVPMPCLQAIDEAHRHPECLDDVRARLDHGDIEGALATVEGLLGPDAVLRSGALRDELETAALRRIAHGLFRAGLTGRATVLGIRPPRRTAEHRDRPRRGRAR